MALLFKEIEPSRPTKLCGDCSRWLSVDQYYSDRSRRDGLNVRCKECERDRTRRRWLQNPERKRASVRRWKKRNRSKVNESEHRRRRERMATDPEFRARVNARKARRQRERILEDPEYAARRRASVQAAKTKRAAVKRKVPAETVHRSEVFSRSRGVCYLCGDEIEEATFHMEHRIPLSRGGSHTYDNISAACVPCNLSKGDRTVLEQMMR